MTPVWFYVITFGGIALAGGMGWTVGWHLRGQRDQNRHHHTWSSWHRVEVARSIPPLINHGQGPVVIKGHMQYRECTSCGLTETKDV